MAILTVKNNLRFLIMLIISGLLIGCYKKSGLMDYKLKKMDAIIKIPGTYKLVTKKDIERISYKKNDLEFKNGLLKMCRLNPKYDFLIDTLNPYKFIVTTEIVPSFKIDSNSFYFIIDHERSISSSRPDVNDSTYYVGSKMGNVADFKFIESKYKRTSYHKTLVSYNYMISSNGKTTGIAFYSPIEQDVKPFIYSIKSAK